ncbi:hypothetical protein L9F63_007613 [Diploptera punctata]|uniref:Single domain-containing protein n=1 Tax=Diploptera punctata TaxID=6984 RepID=A0AAD7Z7R8_DIPPU|nr:hypothetical protein L9F63_007613 [Diploptera punctata]
MKLYLSLFSIFAVITFTATADCPSKCPGCENRTIGESWKVRITSECSGLTCKKTETNRYSWSMKGCAQYRLASGCVLPPANLTLEYPDCCPQPKCPEPVKRCPAKCPGCENRQIGETWNVRNDSGCEITCKRQEERRYSWTMKGC